MMEAADIRWKSGLAEAFSSASDGLRVATSARETKRVVIVCDLLQDDSLIERVQELALPGFSVALGSGTQKQGPYLIEISDVDAQERFVAESLRLAVREALQPAHWERRVRSVCAWLVTALPLAKIAHAIGTLAHVRDEHGTSRTLRFWDPRVMQHARDLFGDTGLPGIDWGLVDGFGRWQLLPESVDGQRWKVPAPATQRLFSLMNTAMQRLSMNGLGGLEASTCWPALREGVQAAQRAGLSHDDDMAWFAADRVRLRRPIEHSTTWGSWFPLIKEGRARYTRATADFDDDDWKTVLDGIAAPTFAEGNRP